jgi:hypothetical protein
MDNSLVERAREHRSSSAVLKLALSNVRARDRASPVLIFEGVDDLGPYEVWANRVSQVVWTSCVPLPGKGKGQVLGLRLQLQRDETGLKENVFFFVDRDFDELRGQGGGPDVFCTETYSVENAFVTEEVLRSLLRDEFRCAAGEEDLDRIVQQFLRVVRQFCECMEDANWRLFVAQRVVIERNIATDNVQRFVLIQLDRVERRYNEEQLKELIKLEREPTEEELRREEPAFRELDRSRRHRGKFLLSLFRRWLELLAEERKQATAGLFKEPTAIRLSVDRDASYRALAGRCSLPEGLQEFLRGVERCCPRRAT